MDEDYENENIQIFWNKTQIDRLLCTLCYYLIFSPMQLICCGFRICEACDKSRLKQLNQCPLCSEPGIPETRYDRGYRRELERLQVNCPRCNDQWSGLYIDLPGHLINHWDIQCHNCDEKFIFPQQLEKHQRETCKSRVVACPLAFLGCSTRVAHNNISGHYLERKHQQYLMKFIKQILPQYSHEHMDLALQKASDEQYQRNLTEYLKKLHALIEEINPIIGNCARLKSERETIATKINEVRTQTTKIKESSDNSAKLIESLHEIFVNMNKLLDEIKSKAVTGPTLLSSDSSYTWKANFHVLINNGGTIQSEPFYTAQSGYKLSINCDISVDEHSGKRYVAVTFMILPGDFDAILTWPIPFPITLTILDLTKTQKHINYTIPRDSQTMALKRPVGNANSVFRIKQFCAVDMLLKDGNNYVQDGFIFTRTHIDFMTPIAQPIPAKGPLRTTEDYIQTNILTNMSVK